MIAAIPAAAVAPERIAVGSVQNIGSEEKTPKAPKVSAIIFNRGSLSAADAPTPIAAIASAIEGNQKLTP